MNLAELAIASARRSPSAEAVVGPDGTLSYQELDQAANRLARWLASRGVAAGDRVAIWAPKSSRVVIAMQAALRLGAAYVPIDALSPVARAEEILRDCDVAAVITTTAFARQLHGRTVLAIEDDGWSSFSPDPLPAIAVGEHALAYILYTSGSTGKPKGVCISHRNALAFVQWGADLIGATAADRFANHAPFNFDLSVFDLYVAFQRGASVALVSERESYVPRRLVAFLAARQITVWYSVPSVLMLMMDHAGLLEHELADLRCVIFAGEPFPIKQLRRLVGRWPGKRFLNFYGPTETNVCTYFDVDHLAADAEAVPIGEACCGDTVWAQRADGQRAEIGEEGELFVTGPTVMLGYWGNEPQGDRPYATGDFVRLMDATNFQFIGRRDHMVKVRGRRIELGEIDVALSSHPHVHAAVTVPVGDGLERKLVAFLIATELGPAALLEIKQHCARLVPHYMIVDDVRWIDSFPRTPNGKIDRRSLVDQLEAPR